MVCVEARACEGLPAVDGKPEYVCPKIIPASRVSQSPCIKRCDVCSLRYGVLYARKNASKNNARRKARLATKRVAGLGENRIDC